MKKGSAVLVFFSVVLCVVAAASEALREFRWKSVRLALWSEWQRESKEDEGER